MQTIPISRAVRATRIAISPRFAMSRRRNMRRSVSEGNIPVLLWRPSLPLRTQHGEGVDHARPRLRRLDHVIEVAHLRGDVRVREAVPIVSNEFLLPLLRVLGLLDLFLE